MALIVQKYGGTSVGSIDRIRNVAARVKRTREAGNQVVAVVSAMSGVTDGLIKMATELDENPPERELDVLLATHFGVHALVLALAAWLTRLSWRWVAVFSVWQTSGLVLSLVFVSLLVKRLLLGIVAVSPHSALFWLPALSSALLWPTVMVSLRRFTQR